MRPPTTATDGTSIDADAGAAAIVISLSKSSAAVAIGAAVAVNNDTRTIAAGSDGTALNSGADLTVRATSTARITTWAIGVAGAVSSGNGGGVSFAGAGSGAGSTIGQTVHAILKAGTVIAAGGLNVTATDGTQIDTQAGGIALTVARGPPNALAVGISVAANSITDTVTAEVSGASTVNAATLSITASVTSAKIDAWTIAGAGNVTQGGDSGGLSFSGAGAGSGNTITDTVLAALSGDATVTLTGTAPASITASDTSAIFAIAGSAAFGIRYGGSGGSGNVSIGAAVAINTIDNSVKAQVVNVPTFTTPGGLTMSATEAAGIEAITIGVAGTVTSGSGGGVAFAGAGSGSGNTITTDTEATITASTVDATGSGSGGPVSLTATDNSSILAIAGALGLSGKFGGSSNGSVAVGLSSPRARSIRRHWPRSPAPRSAPTAR